MISYNGVIGGIDSNDDFHQYSLYGNDEIEVTLGLLSSPMKIHVETFLLHWSYNKVKLVCMPFF